MSNEAGILDFMFATFLRIDTAKVGSMSWGTEKVAYCEFDVLA